MPFIPEETQKAMRKRLRDMVDPVTMRHFTREHDCRYCPETLRLLAELSGLSDKLQFEVHYVDVDTEIAQAYKIDKVPATVLEGGQDRGIRFFGTPAGFEFPTLVDDILMVSRAESGLTAASRSKLETLREPVHLEVFVTPGCPYCSRAVHQAHQLAMESEWVTADMVEATEFPELAERYHVSGVPKVMANGRVATIGLLPETAFLDVVLDAVGPEVSQTAGLGSRVESARSHQKGEIDVMIDFNAAVLERSMTTPVVVDFWAEWCGPCHALGPIVEALAAEADGRWELVKIDVEKQPGPGQDLGLQAIPAVKMFHEGKVIAEFVGVRPAVEIRRWLDTNLPHVASPS